MTTGRIIEIIVLIVLIVICAYYYVKARKEAYLNAKAMDEQLKKEKSKVFTTVKIDGMMCEKCASRVTEALSNFGEVSINLEEKTATIISDETLDIAEIESTVNELGFKFEGAE